jgi:VIT1/CCC1 family predicted Fe2+/Mn2+ transporter
MKEYNLDNDIKKVLLQSQKNEITEHHLYLRLSQSLKDANNSKVLQTIANEELRHYHFWREYTGREVKPDRWRILKYFWISKILGITFGIKLMERGEQEAQITYEKIAREIPEARNIVEDEDRHEHELLNLLDEERLKYIGSIVLGLNDALVELTGALAGLTFAMQNTRLIALAGLITGIAASLSMAASEYLSTRAEAGGQNPLKSSIYTGIAYIITVFLLIFPYLIFANYLFCLGFTIVNALLVIIIFTFYISVAKELPFWRRFIEMASVSLGVALISFGIGYLIRVFIGIEM